MKPDRNNYQIWFTDYLDGNLPPEQESILLSFLEENPDLKEEMNDLLSLRIEPEVILFTGRDRLKRSPAEMTEEQFGMLCIAAEEGDITADGRTELEQIISSDPEKAKSYELFRKTKLRAPEVKFPHKNKLRKEKAAFRIMRYSLIPLSAAAAIILFIIVFRTPVQQVTSDKLSKNTDTPYVAREVLKNIPKSVKVAAADITQIKNENPPLPNNALIKESAQTDTSEQIITRTTIPEPFEMNTGMPVNLPEYRLASLTLTEVSYEPADEPEPGPFTFISKFFREKISKSGKEEKGRLKAYEIADAGITGLNKLFGWDMSLEKNRNVKGEVLSVRFSSKILRFNAPVKKGL